MYVGLGLTLLALVVPYVDRAGAGVIAEHYRVRKLRRTVPFVPEDDQREPQMQVHDEADAVDRGKLDSRTGHGFAQLGIKDRTLLWLAYVEEMSHADIGATVGVRTASVKVMLSRARTRLAAALKAMGIARGEIMKDETAQQLLRGLAGDEIPNPSWNRVNLRASFEDQLERHRAPFRMLPWVQVAVHAGVGLALAGLAVWLLLNLARAA